jgi:DNA anti-recombination protein RmuC
MSALERGLYVAVGAADLAGEKIRELPAVKVVVERTNKIRSTSLIDQAREIEPKVRQQVTKLQTRGETVVNKIQKDAKEFGEQVREFPENARKQLEELPENAKKQVTEIRGRIEKRFGRENGSGTTAKPAAKTSAAKASAKSSS